MPKDNIQSSYAKQQFRINEILRCIKRHGQIHKFELMEEMQITISEYNKLKPFIEYFGEKQEIFYHGNLWDFEKEPEQIKKENLEEAKQEAKEILSKFKGVEVND